MKWQHAFTFPVAKGMSDSLSPCERLAYMMTHQPEQLRAWVHLTYETLFCNFGNSLLLTRLLPSLHQALQLQDTICKVSGEIWTTNQALLFLKWTGRAELAARRLQRYHEARCEKDMTEEEEKRCHTKAWHFVPPPPQGFFWYEQEDPRGAPLYLFPEHIRKTAQSDYTWGMAVYVPRSD